MNEQPLPMLVPGSPYPPAVVNDLVQLSGRLQDSWSAEHGIHRTHDTLRVAYAGGHISFNGGVWQVAPGSVGIVDVHRGTSGIGGDVLIKLDFEFRSAGSWVAMAWASPMKVNTAPPVELASSKTPNTVELRLSNQSDRSFVFLAVGVVA